MQPRIRVCRFHSLVDTYMDKKIVQNRSPDGHLRMNCGTEQLWCTIVAHSCPIDAVRQRWELSCAKYAFGLRAAREPICPLPLVMPLGFMVARDRC